MDRELFLEGLPYCSTHNHCRDCPIKGRCKGAYDILPEAFCYIEELTNKLNGRIKKR